MFKTLIISLLMLVSLAASATDKKGFYQVDLIIFTNENALNNNEDSILSTLSHVKNRQPLQEQSSIISPYHLLPFSFTHLKEEFWALKRKPQYRVLINYSWLQPLNNNASIFLPKVDKEGWQLEGNIKIKRLNYYEVNSEFLIKTPNNTSFVFSEKQRLRGGQIYYFDNPKVGMLIKVHQMA